MGSGKLDGKCHHGGGSSLGLQGCGVACAICGDSDLEKISTRPCLAISKSAQIQAQKQPLRILKTTTTTTTTTSSKQRPGQHAKETALSTILAQKATWFVISLAMNNSQLIVSLVNDLFWSNTSYAQHSSKTC